MQPAGEAEVEETPVSINLPLSSSNNSQRQRPLIIWFFGCLQVLIFVGVFVVPVTELYFAFNHVSCQHITFPEFAITLKDWLIVDSIVTIFLSALSLTLIALAEEHLRELMTIFVGWIVVLFTACWTLVGLVLFSKYLIPSHCCENDVSTLMWFRLLEGFWCVLYYMNGLDIRHNH